MVMADYRCCKIPEDANGWTWRDRLDLLCFIKRKYLYLVVTKLQVRQRLISATYIV